jgi:hypothetical protein
MFYRGLCGCRMRRIIFRPLSKFIARYAGRAWFLIAGCLGVWRRVLNLGLPWTENWAYFVVRYSWIQNYFIALSARDEIGNVIKSSADTFSSEDKDKVVTAANCKSLGGRLQASWLLRPVEPTCSPLHRVEVRYIHVLLMLDLFPLAKSSLDCYLILVSIAMSGERRGWLWDPCRCETQTWQRWLRLLL